MSVRKLLSALVLGLGMTACAEPTEVVVFVDTTLGVPCQIDRIEIVARAGEQEVVRVADPARGPQSVTILDEGAGPAFALEVRGMRGETLVASAVAPSLTFSPESRRSVSVILDESCRAAPCELAGQLTPFSVPAPATRIDCRGISDRYTVRQTGFASVENACETGSLRFAELTEFPMVGGDERALPDGELKTALEGFDFRFYGERIRSVWIADDGYLSFGEAPQGKTADVAVAADVAAPGAPAFSVMAFWDDLEVSQPTRRICAAMTGSAPERTLLVTWDNACFEPACAPTDEATFTVGLFEGSNDVVIEFHDMASPTNALRAQGQDAAVGIRGLGSPACSARECNADGNCPDGRPCGFTQLFAEQPQDGLTELPILFEPGESQ